MERPDYQGWLVHALPGSASAATAHFFLSAPPFLFQPPPLLVDPARLLSPLSCGFDGAFLPQRAAVSSRRLSSSTRRASSARCHAGLPVSEGPPTLSRSQDLGRRPAAASAPRLPLRWRPEGRDRGSVISPTVDSPLPAVAGRKGIGPRRPESRATFQGVGHSDCTRSPAFRRRMPHRRPMRSRIGS